MAVARSESSIKTIALTAETAPSRTHSKVRSVVSRLRPQSSALTTSAPEFALPEEIKRAGSEPDIVFMVLTINGFSASRAVAFASATRLAQPPGGAGSLIMLRATKENGREAFYLIGSPDLHQIDGHGPPRPSYECPKIRNQHQHATNYIRLGAHLIDRA